MLVGGMLEFGPDDGGFVGKAPLHTLVGWVHLLLSNSASLMANSSQVFAMLNGPPGKSGGKRIE